MKKLNLSAIYDKLYNKTDSHISKINNATCPYKITPDIVRIEGSVFNNDMYIGSNDVV